MDKEMKGMFKPSNPQKYDGDPTNIVYRSSYELKFFNYIDRDPRIIKWSSEEVCIPYRSPKDNRIHRYYPDVILTILKDGKKVTYMIEIKPFKQTRPPEPPKDKRGKARYLNEVITWGINESKWKSATEFCKDRGWEFKIFTENELGIK